MTSVDRCIYDVYKVNLIISLEWKTFLFIDLTYSVMSKASSSRM